MFRLAMGVAGAFWAGLARGSVRWVALAAVAGAISYFHNELTELFIVLAKLVGFITSGLFALLGLVLSWLGSLLGRLWEDKPPKCDFGYVLDAGKRACVPRCGAGSTFEAGTGQCLPTCSTGYVLDPVTKQCARVVADSRVKLRQLHATTIEHRIVELHLADFSASCFWRHSEREIVDCEPAIQGAPVLRFEELLKAVVEILSKSDRLVLIGTASREGELNAQVGVASARARHLAQWISERTNYQGKLALMNLGQFVVRDCPRCGETDTRWERPIIIVGVMKKHTDAELSQAIFSLLGGRDSSLPNRAHYSTPDPAIVPFAR